MTDIAVQTGGFGNRQFISYFSVMSDQLFAKYQNRGLDSRNDVIISRAERDADPLQCAGEQFAKNYDSGDSPGHWFYLSGYQAGY